MAFIRRSLLILFTLIVSGAQLFASSREERAFAAVTSEFQNKVYDRAEIHLIQYLQDYRKSTNAPQAVLLLAQAQFYLGKFPDVIGHLTDTTNLARARTTGLADRYIYWTAEAQYAAGDYSNAAATFISLLDQFPKSPLAVNAAVEAVASLEKLGQWQKADELLTDTNGVFQQAARLDPDSETIANGRLLQAESRFVRQDYAGTIGLLKLLNPAVLPPEQDWTRARLMIRAYMGQKDLDSALTVATNLLQIAREGHGEIWPANLAESVVLYAGLLEQDRQIDNAMSAWSENLTNTAPAEQQQYAVLKIVGLASEQNNLAEAEADLDKFVAQFPSSPAADPALLTLGELQLKDYIARPSATNDHLALAQAKLDQFIATYTNSPNLGKAILDRGWCSWLKNEYYDSLTEFQSAANHPLAQEDLAVARFKIGDSYFALHRFSDATNGYYSVLTDFAGVPNIMDSLGARALYQILRAQLELRDSTGLDDTMKQFLGKFASSAPADSSLLLAGQGFSSFGSPAKAREVLQTFEYERPNSPLMADVVFAVGRTFEREQNWAAAATNYEAWLSEYHTNTLRPQVEYARDWAVAQTGDEAQAFGLFTNFVGEYTNTFIGQYTNTLTPLAWWWLADHYFRLGTTNYGQAELYYQQIPDKFPNDTLAAPARLMAGQAAMRLFNYPEAAKVYFFPLISATNCSSDLRDRAIFAYAEACLRMFVSSADTNYTSLQDVTTYLAQVYPETATNVAGAIAWCETGDLDLQMNAFDLATNAYAQVITAPFATAELRNRAQVGLGNVLKKKAEGLPPDLQQPLYLLALNNYEDVFYNASGFSDPWWAKEAALQALPLMPQLQKGNVDQFIDSVERWLPSLKDTMEKRRQALKN